MGGGRTKHTHFNKNGIWGDFLFFPFCTVSLGFDGFWCSKAELEENAATVNHPAQHLLNS